jgi:UDP-4-amino-4,6-dideoxy-N-acetyl-beta-L-altrosamine transaminase
VLKVLRSDWLTTGPAVQEFETALAERTGARYAVVVSNGTAALHLACLAAAVGPGDLVISSPNTFVASMNGALYCGARPAFVDIDPGTYNLDIEALVSFLERYHGEAKLKALIPVHFAGQPCDMERIARAARKTKMTVIEDASHALGAQWKDSRGEWHAVGSCSHSDMTTLSFHPVKHITTGEGGAILTNRSDLHEKLKRLRNHGIVRNPGTSSNGHGAWYYEMQDLGFNYRLTDLQCALGLSQLRKLEAWVARRREIASLYDRLLGGLNDVTIPHQRPNARSSYHLYVIQVPRRSKVYATLQARGIGVQIHYLPVHLHPLYRTRFGFKPGDFPVAEAYYERALSLPIFPRLRDEEVEHVVDELRGSLRK